MWRRRRARVASLVRVWRRKVRVQVRLTALGLTRRPRLGARARAIRAIGCGWEGQAVAELC